MKQLVNTRNVRCLLTFRHNVRVKAYFDAGRLWLRLVGREEATEARLQDARLVLVLRRRLGAARLASVRHKRLLDRVAQVTPLARHTVALDRVQPPPGRIARVVARVRPAVHQVRDQAVTQSGSKRQDQIAIRVRYKFSLCYFVISL